VGRQYERCNAKTEHCSATARWTTRSGGRQPAVGMVTQLQRCSCTHHRPLASARQLRSSHCELVSKNHGWLTPAAPGCTVFGRRRNSHSCGMRTHANRERRASARRGFGKRASGNVAAKSRETASTMLTNAGAVAVANPRGAYAPRS
jgi:hypothetical protein